MVIRLWCWGKYVPRISALTETLVSLHRQIDEASVNELALIATLQELLPGFSQRFDQLRIGIEKQFAENDQVFLARLEQAMRLRVQ
jgi:hypothetical protein